MQGLQVLNSADCFSSGFKDISFQYPFYTKVIYAITVYNMYSLAKQTIFPLHILAQEENHHKEEQVLMFYHLKTRCCVNTVHM